MYTNPQKKLSSHHSTKQYQTLHNYRTYLNSEVQCLILEADKDEAELDLLQLNIYESMNDLTKNKQILRDELARLLGRQVSEKEYSLEIEGENIKTVIELQDNYRIQEDLRKKQRQLRDEAHEIMRELNSSEVQMDPNNIQNGIYGKIAEIQLQMNELRRNLVLQEHQFKKLELQEKTKIEKIKQQDLVSTSIRDQIDNIDSQIEKKDEEYLCSAQKKNKVEQNNKIKKICLENVRKQMEDIGKKLKKSKQIHENLLQEKENLVYELEVAFKDLQMEERGREEEEDRLKNQLLKREQGRLSIQNLNQYISELCHARQQYLSILQIAKKDHILMDNILKTTNPQKQPNLSILQEMNLNKRPGNKADKQNKHSKKEKEVRNQQLRFKRSMTSSTLTSFMNPRYEMS